MRVLYDSQNPAYKTPFGCLQQEQPCRIRIRIPTECGVRKASLELRGEYTGAVSIPLARKAETEPEGYESFAAEFSLKECDLYFYYFHTELENGVMDLYREGFRDVKIGGENDPRWQLTVYPKGYTTPRAFQGQVMYQIFPDRFFRYGQNDTSDKLTPFTVHENVHDCPAYLPDEHGNWNNDFFGGTLKGIEKKLPYLERLHVSVIYLNPIFMAFSNHRYDTANYRRIDPLLGTEEDFESLCKAAHERGMKIILDGVFSHTGSDSLYFDKNGRYGHGAYHDFSSPYRSWYQFHGETSREYTCWWGIDTLPCTDELDESYLDYIIRGEDSVLAHWMRLGADGFRLDVADELPDEFIRQLHRRVKELNPDGIVIGEVWEDASNKVAYSVRRRYFTNLELDATMNYPYKDAIITFVKGEMDAVSMARAMMSIAENYPKPILDCAMNSLSTHDTMRILTVLGADRFDYTRDEKVGARIPPHLYQNALRRLRAATFLQFTLPGSGCIYYGDEVGMEGYEDPFNRRYFPWDDINDGLLLFFEAITEQKRLHPALQIGDLKIVRAEGRVLIFSRECEEELVTVAVNLSEGSYTLSYEPEEDRLSFFQSASFSDGQITLNRFGFALISRQKPGESDQKGEKTMSNPIVTITMENGGVIKAELYPELAPNTVNNFISLIQKGFYDGTIFHRVIPGFMIQGGDPEGTGMGGPGYSIRGEFSHNGFANDLKHTVGVLSMARAMRPDSAGSQFFIMVADAPHLDGEYAAFGKVVEGMDVAQAIVSQPRGWNDRPRAEQKMKSVTVETFGVKYPEPEKL